MKWVRCTTARLSEALQSLNISVCPRTVARLLRMMKYSLRVNHKTLCAVDHPQRNLQFERISVLRNRGRDQKIPVISIDTKKKELIGRFKNHGSKWGRHPECVNDHDFRSLADGIAVPYGIYDIHTNTGTVFVGTSNDTPEFAVDCVAAWWRDQGQLIYPHTSELIILADSGGSNGCRPRAWKSALQNSLCDPCDITVTVAHYPTGTSKWNPVEHRLFSEISKNWAGVPLVDLETILGYIDSTTTSAGLSVTAHLVEKQYEKGVRISESEMESLNITADTEIPRWNYTIRPR